MTTQQLKECLIHRISEMEDHTFLEAINTILDVNTESEMIELPPEFFAERTDDCDDMMKEAIY